MLFFYSLFYILPFLCILQNGAAMFQTLDLTTFNFLGDAHIFNNTIRLTGDLGVPTTSAGRVIYNKPVTFRSPTNPNPLSFTASFSFSIADLNPNSIGGGLAFVISKKDDVIGQAGSHLGILPEDIAIEFDTCKDVEVNDINGNHIGLNIGSMVSKQVANLELANVSLRSGKIVNVWIEYSGISKQFNVLISHLETKPESLVLSVMIDLYEYVKDIMYTGLCGSTQGSTEIHSISSWSFTSSFDDEPDTEKSVPNAPPPPPTSTTTPTDPTTQIRTKVIAGTIASVVTAVILALITIYKAMNSTEGIFNNNACCGSTINNNIEA